MKQGIFLKINAKKDEATEANIEIYGEIGWDIWYGKLKEMVDGLSDDVSKVIFDIYSPGGSVWDGNAMIQLIGGMKQETVANVQVAASMATLIAVACDSVEMAENGRWLIHNPWAYVAGDSAEMAKKSKELEEAKQEAAEFYAKRTGQSVDSINSLMDDERWLRAKEAEELGFVKTIIDPFDVVAYATMRGEMVASGKWPKDLEASYGKAGDNADNTDDNTKGNSKKTGDGASNEPNKNGETFEGWLGEKEIVGYWRSDGIVIGLSPDKQNKESVLARAICEISDLQAEIVAFKSADIDNTKAIADTKKVHDDIVDAAKLEMTKQRSESNVTISDLTTRLAKLLPAMSDGSDDAKGGVPPATFDAAVESCGGWANDGLEKAAVEYKDLYDKYMKAQGDKR